MAGFALIIVGMFIMAGAVELVMSKRSTTHEASLAASSDSSSEFAILE